MRAMIAVCWLLALGSICAAGELRAFRPIPTPETHTVAGARSVADRQLLGGGQLAGMIGKVMQSWNKGEGMAQHLAGEFPDKTELLDAIRSKVPLDAQIRILSVRNTQVYDQTQRVLPDGSREIVSTVLLTADTAIEFNDPARGFRRLEGTNEYLIRVVEAEK